MNSCLFFIGSLLLSGVLIEAKVMPVVHGARYNSLTKGIEIDIEYKGGCKNHRFRLDGRICVETFPVQCPLDLVDLTTNDPCSDVIKETIFISLREAGLDDAYHTGALLTIGGNKNSKVQIELS